MLPLRRTRLYGAELSATGGSVMLSQTRMALTHSKIVGFEVRPVTDKSRMQRAGVPLSSSMREMFSGQRLWPRWCSDSVAFMFAVLGSSGLGVAPTAVGGDELVRLRRTPCPWGIDDDRGMFDQHRIDHGPGGFDGVFTGKQRAVTGHRVGQ